MAPESHTPFDHQDQLISSFVADIYGTHGGDGAKEEGEAVSGRDLEPSRSWRGNRWALLPPGREGCFCRKEEAG